MMTFVEGKNLKPTKYEKQCILCRKVLSTNQALRGHYRIHTGVFPFNCKMCTFAAVNKSHMTYHVRTTHLSERHQKPSPTSKRKKKIVTANWDQHLKINERKLEKLKSVVEGYQQVDEDLFHQKQCFKCHRFMRTKELLIQHFYSHTDIRPFKCRVCGRRFIAKGQVKTHLQNVHASIFTSEKTSDSERETTQTGNLEESFSLGTSENQQDTVPVKKTTKRRRREEENTIEPTENEIINCLQDSFHAAENRSRDSPVPEDVKPFAARFKLGEYQRMHNHDFSETPRSVKEESCDCDYLNGKRCRFHSRKYLAPCSCGARFDNPDDDPLNKVPIARVKEEHGDWSLTSFKKESDERVTHTNHPMLIDEWKPFQ